MASLWDNGLPVTPIDADLDLWAEGLPLVYWDGSLLVLAPAWDAGLPVIIAEADGSFEVWADGLPYVGSDETAVVAPTAVALIYLLGLQEDRAGMNPILAGQTNPLGYLAEKRDGSGPVSTGANVTLKIRKVADGSWWNAGTSQWQATEVAIAPVHVSGGAWEYVWSVALGDAGDIVQVLWQDETDLAVSSVEYGRIYSPDSLIAHLLQDLLSDKQPFAGAHINRDLSTLAVSGEAVVALSAYGAAKTGDKMDLVNAPNPAAVAALQSGLAQDATTQAIKTDTDRIPTSPAVAGEAATALTTYGAAKTGDKMDMVSAPNPTAVAALQSGLAKDATAQAIKTDTDRIPTSPAVAGEAATALTAYGAAKTGDRMDLVDAPNAAAVTALQSGLATAAELGDLNNLSSAQVQAAAVAALQQLGIALTSDLAALALEATAQAIKTSTDRIPTAPAAVGDLLTEQQARDALLKAPTPGTPAAGSIDAFWAALTAKLPTGALAGSSEVTAIQNNTGVARIVPPVMERLDSGTEAYVVRLYLYDSAGNMAVPDSPPTLHVENQAGTSHDDHLDATTMALDSAGVYRATYTVQSADALEQLNWKFSVVEGGVTRQWGNTSLVVDTTAVDFTAQDRSTLSGVAASIAALNNLDSGTVQAAALAALQGYGPAKPGDAMDLLAATLSAVRAGLALSGEAATALSQYAPAKPGDKMDLVNTPNATGVQAVQSGLAKDATAQAIKTSTDRIPSAPAVAGEAGTALSTYGPAKPGDKMDLVDVPNATGVAALQSGLAQEATAEAVKARTDRIPDSPAVAGEASTAVQSYGPAKPGDAMALTDAAVAAAQQGVAQTGEAATALTNYGPAKPGAKMDLVDAPNPTAVGALQNGVAKEATAQAIQARTDLIPAAPAVAGEAAQALTSYDPPTYDQMRAALAAVSSLSQDQVQQAAANALAGYGSAKSGDSMALTTDALNAVRDGLATSLVVLSWLQAMVRSDVAVPADVGGSYNPADSSLEAIREALSAGGTGSGSDTAGTGRYSIDVDLTDNLGRKVVGVGLVVLALTGTEAGWARPDQNTGVAHFRLDPGTYLLRPDSSGTYQWGDDGEYVLYVAGDAQEHLTCTLKVLPTAVPADICRCYDDFKWVVGGSAVGAGEAQLTIVRVILPEGQDNPPPVFYAASGTVLESDGTGRVTVDLAQGATVEVLEECGDTSRDVTFTVPAQDTAYISDYVNQ